MALKFRKTVVLKGNLRNGSTVKNLVILQIRKEFDTILLKN